VHLRQNVQNQHRMKRTKTTEITMLILMAASCRWDDWTARQHASRSIAHRSRNAVQLAKDTLPSSSRPTLAAHVSSMAASLSTVIYAVVVMFVV
jgi:hypothetical protein